MLWPLFSLSIDSYLKAWCHSSELSSCWVQTSPARVNNRFRDAEYLHTPARLLWSSNKYFYSQTVKYFCSNVQIFFRSLFVSFSPPTCPGSAVWQVPSSPVVPSSPGWRSTTEGTGEMMKYYLTRKYLTVAARLDNWKCLDQIRSNFPAEYLFISQHFWQLSD